MALKRDVRYPGRFIAANTAHPQGAFKNRTTPTAQDGSYLEADWMNDIDGFFAKILNVAGVTPNGIVDDGSTSQLYNAMLTATPGRLINVQTFFSNGTYTATPGTKRVVVEMVGGGGGGAGANAATSTTIAIGGAGGAGAYVKAQFTSGFNGVNVTVGSRGLAGTTSSPYANSGGASSFGSLVSAAGGDSGKPAGPSNSFPFTTVAATVSAGASGSGIIFGTPGEGASSSIALSTATAVSSPGGSSHFGAGGFITAYGAKGIDGAGYGAGGGPVATSTGTPNTALAGGNGSPGIVIVWEYA